MPEGGTAANIIDDVVVLIDLGSKDASNLELLAPGELLLAQEEVKHLSALVVSGLLGSVIRSLDVNEASGLLGEFDAIWLRHAQLQGK